MSIISRNPAAPYEDGDVLSAGTEPAPADLELDLVRLFNEFNGGIDDANIKALAGIQGSKLAASSIPGDRIAPLAVSNDKLQSDTIVEANIKDDEVLLSKLQDNSVSHADNAFAFGPVTIPGGEVDVVTASVLTGKDPTQVLIMWSFTVFPEIPAGGSVDTYHELIISRGSLGIYRSTSAILTEAAIPSGTREVTCFSVFHMDPNAPANAMVGYTFSVAASAGGRPHIITDNFVTLFNVRR